MRVVSSAAVAATSAASSGHVSSHGSDVQWCRNVTLIAASGRAPWSKTGLATEAKPAVTWPSSIDQPRRRSAVSVRRSSARVAGPRPVRRTNVEADGNSARTCGAGRCRRIARPDAVSWAWQADADLRHQRLRAGRALLDQVQRLVAVQDAEVRGVPGAVDELAQQRPGEPFQGVVAQVRRAQLERRDAQAVPAFRGQVHDKTGGLQLVEQVVGRRAGRPASRAIADAVTGPGRVASSRSTASPRRSAGTSLLSPMPRA